MDIMDMLLSRIPTAEKTSLIKEVLGLDEDVSVLPSGDGSYTLSFYGKELNYECKTILKNAKKFKEFIHKEIAAAKSRNTTEVDIMAALEDAPEFDLNQFYLDSLPKAKTEESLSEIFESNHSALVEFYNSPERGKLDQDSRGFIYQVVTNPFKPLWADLDAL